MDAMETRSAVTHLLRRTSFGAHPDTVDLLSVDGYEAAVAAVCDRTPPDDAADAVAVPTFDTAAILEGRRGDPEARRQAGRQAAAEVLALTSWWLRRMATSERPLRERLTFHWHDHFATSVDKVKLAEVMFNQRTTVYERAFGTFELLAGALVGDPAMLVWLDGNESTRQKPNENFAREFLELFTLGLGHHGEQPFTEPDVLEAARAFTGWRIDRAALAGRVLPRRHDDGTKTVLGQTGPWASADVVRLATGHPACAPHVVSRLYSRFARPAGPTDPVVVDLAATFVASGLDIDTLVRSMLLHPDFVAPATRTALVKSPVDYVVGIARTLRVPLEDAHVAALVRLGQVPFAPPDVAGWPSNEAWSSTASALERLDVATGFAARADLASIEALDAGERPAALARWLGIDAWSATTAAALAAAAGEPVTAMAIALSSPEFILA